MLKVNNKGANLLGYSRDYLLGKPRLPYLTQPKREAFSGHLGSISREVPSASAGVDCLHSSRRVVHAKFESVLIDGKRGITADMSLRFGLFFGMSAGFWLNLQKDYELRIAKRDRLPELEKTVERFG